MLDVPMDTICVEDGDGIVRQDVCILMGTNSMRGWAKSKQGHLVKVSLNFSHIDDLIPFYDSQFPSTNLRS